MNEVAQSGLSEDTRRLLAQASTATLTTQLFKRGLRNTFIQGARRLTPDAPVMVGLAYTLRMIPAREDLDHPGMFEGRSHPQRRAIEECPAGQVLVIDCRGKASGGSLGDILIARLIAAGGRGRRDRRCDPRHAPDHAARLAGLRRGRGSACELCLPPRGRPAAADRLRRGAGVPGRRPGRRWRGRGRDPAPSGGRGRGRCRSPGADRGLDPGRGQGAGRGSSGSTRRTRRPASAIRPGRRSPAA